MSKKKRRRFSPEFKAEIVLAVLTGEKSQAQICREHQISAQQFSNWKRQFLANAAQRLRNRQGQASMSKWPSWSGWWDA